MRKLMAVLFAALIIAPIVRADSYPTGKVYATILSKYDVAATSFIYTAYGDQNASLAPVTLQGVAGTLGPGTPVYKKVKTTGSSTSITANTAGQAPFSGRAVGDLLLFNALDTAAGTLNQLVEYERVITTFTDANNIVVDSAIDLSAGYTFRYKKLLAGSGTNDGWIDIGGYDAVTFQFQVDTLNATSLDSVLECRVSKFARTFQVQTDNYVAVGSKIAKVSRADADYEQCRVGWKVNTDAGVQSVSVYFAGTK